METKILARTGEVALASAFERPCYRIPALTVTASERLVAAWDVRADWRDLPGPFDIVYRTSDDHGASWTPPRHLRYHSGLQGFGDASLLTDPASGDVLCWYVSSTGRSFFDADAGPTGEGLRLWLARSVDDGETWAHRDLTDSLKPGWVTGMFASSGNGSALRSGRLLQPFVMRDAEGRHWAAVASSDDGGENWRLGEPIGPDCDENKVVEPPASVDVLLHARATPRRRQAVSTDGGVTFTQPQPHPELVDPACNGGLVRWGNVLVCSLLDDPTERRNLGLRFSSDGGTTWSTPVTVDSGASAYSVLAELADGTLGVMWEAGDYAAIRFARITRDEVDADRLGTSEHSPTLDPVHSAGTSAKPPEVAPTPSPEV